MYIDSNILWDGIGITWKCGSVRSPHQLASIADQRVLRWFGHVERMDEYRMARRLLMAEVSGGIQPWEALGNRGMTVEAARQCTKDRKEWRALVYM